MPETTDSLPTRWPDWVQITTDRRVLDDPPADVHEIWTFVYAGFCHGCTKTTEGDRAAVIVWAQDHFSCEPPPAPEPLLRQPDAPVGRIEDLSRNPDGSITIPAAGTWTWGEPS